jgi:hypothetical protein
MTLGEIKELAAAGSLVGIFPDLPAEIYHSFTNYLSATQIGAWLRSEQHYASLLAGEKIDTASLELGRLIHLATSELQLFKDSVVVGPEKNRNTKEWKEFERTVPMGKTPLKPSELLEIITIANAIHAHPKVGGLFHQAHVELSFFGICPVTKMPVKCRTDLISQDFKIMGDIKSTNDARPEEFMKQSFYLNYHVKVAHYLDVIQIVTSVRPEMAALIAAETNPPYCVVPFVFDKDEEFTIDPLEVGAQRAREVRSEIALRLQEKSAAEAMGHTFRWRGYSDKFMPLTLPRFAARAEAQARGALV